MAREGNENYTRVLLLLMEGGGFISREILKRETQKKEDNLNDLLKCHKEQLKRRFTEEEMLEVLPSIGGARIDYWNIALLTGVTLELFRTTLTLREKRELLVIRNVRDELLSHVTDVSLDDETFEDLRDQLEEALNTLSEGLEPALVVNCQRIVNRYLDGPIHMPSSLEHLEDMCDIDDPFENVTETLRNETKSVVHDIIDIVKKAEDEGREMKEPKVIEFVIQAHCKNKKVLECVETALDNVTGNFGCKDDLESEYIKIKRALEDIFEEVKTICQVFTKYEKGKGAVFRIECKSYRILLDVVTYLESLQCLERLDEVATLVRKHFGTENRLSLTCFFNEENMKEVYEAIRTDNIEYSRSIALSMQANDLQGLLNIWEMFECGGAQNQLNQIAEALSEYVGSKITITASVDKQNYKVALQEAVRQITQAEEAQGTTEKVGDEETKRGTAESSDNPEDNNQTADVGRAVAPRRGHVQLVAVKPGRRKTTLFDEVISEGEPDRVSEMGYDSRVGRPARAAVTSSKIDEGENELVSESVTSKTEEDKLEEPNLEGYKCKDSDEKHQSLETDNGLTGDSVTDDVASTEKPDTTQSEELQNIASEEKSDSGDKTVNSFYRSTAFMTSRIREIPDSTRNMTQMDSSLPGRSCCTRLVSSSAEQDHLVALTRDELHLSVVLSSALDNIGINRNVFNLQQEGIHISESVLNQMSELSNRQVSVFHFGSQAEGTALSCEHTKLDTMVILDEYSVIQNSFSLQQPSKFENIILAENTRPGYMHLPLTDEMFRDIEKESSLICAVESQNIRHNTKTEATEVHCGFGADTVLAIRMSAWPVELRRSLQNRAKAWAFDISGEDLLEKPLAVVPYKSTDYRHGGMEWRISTAHIERALITSLNIYQKRVFFLFRAVIRHVLNPHISKPLTSYMIKNIFFHVASATWPVLWNDATVVLCLIGCLNKTLQFIRANNLPNFFIPKENLISEIFNPDDRRRADEILLQTCSQPYESIACITEGDIGNVLDIQTGASIDQTQIYTVDRISSHLLNKYEPCVQVAAYKDFLLEWIVERSSDENSSVENHVQILKFLKNRMSVFEHVNSSLVANIAYEYISTSLASHLICLALKAENSTERDWYLCAATIFFYKGMKSDALSSRMKFITALIALGHLSSAREMLVEIEVSNKMNSHAICPCKRSHNPCEKARKGEIMENVCSCVTFLRTESLATPLAIRYEMYGSETTSDLAMNNVRMMKWGVVDAKVYFGFLNTVLYSTIEDMEEYFGSPDVHHNETLMNFLGLWSEFIGDYNTAAMYYKESLRQSPVQNAVKWYICLLLFRRWFRQTDRTVLE